MPFGIVGLLHPKIAQGLDYWRLLNPLLHMAHLGYPARCIRLGNDLPTFDGEPPRVIHLAETFAATRGADRRTVQLCRRYRMLYCLDIADDPTEYGDSSQSPMKRPEGLWEAKLECIREADLVTCPTPKLRAILLGWNPNVEVIPDLAEAAHWDEPPPAERFPPTTLGLRGGSTHDKDWEIVEPVWRKLAEKYSDICFVTQGLRPVWADKLPPERYRHLTWALIDGYQANIKWVDIGCAPLADIAFNRSKSPITFYDWSLGGAATVASPLVYGEAIQPAITGYLASGEDEWLDFLSFLIENGEERQRIARQAREWVVGHRCMNAAWCLHRRRIYEDHYARVYGSVYADTAARGMN